MAKKKQRDIGAWLYPPTRAARSALAAMERRANATPVTIIPPAPPANAPLDIIPGDLAFIVARPGHGKSSCLASMARRLATAGASVLFASWELGVEEVLSIVAGVNIRSGSVSVADRDRLVNYADTVWIFGRGEESPPGKMPTVADLSGAIAWLHDQGVELHAVMVDYLQRIVHPRSWERARAVGENAEALKDLAVSARVPLVVAAQAGRQVDTYPDVRMPRLADVQWSSSAEQVADVVVGLTMPGKYLPSGQLIRLPDGDSVEVTHDLLLARALKRRWGRCGPLDAYALRLTFHGGAPHVEGRG